jgi:hypothetical protein
LLKLEVVAPIIGPFESKELGDGVDIKCHQWNFVKNLIHFLQFVHLKISNILVPHHIVQSPFLFSSFVFPTFNSLKVSYKWSFNVSSWNYDMG